MTFWLFGILKLSLDLKLLLLDFDPINNIILNSYDIWEDTSKIYKSHLYSITRPTMWFQFLGLWKFFFFKTLYHVSISTRYNLGKFHKTSMNFHSYRNDPLRLKTLNFTSWTSNLMQCPVPWFFFSFIYISHQLFFNNLFHFYFKKKKKNHCQNVYQTHHIYKSLIFPSSNYILLINAIIHIQNLPLWSKPNENKNTNKLKTENPHKNLIFKVKEKNTQKRSHVQQKNKKNKNKK
jgi:hypothetical protein